MVEKILHVVPEATESQECDSAYFESKKLFKANVQDDNIQFNSSGLLAEDSNVIFLPSDFQRLTNQLKEVDQVDSTFEEEGQVQNLTDLFETGGVNIIREEIRNEHIKELLKDKKLKKKM